MNTTNIYVVTVRHFFGPSDTCTVDDTPMTVAEAVARIRELESARYELAHNESSRSDYYMIDQTTLDELEARHDDLGRYDWDDYEGDADNDEKTWAWRNAQDIELIEDERLELCFGTASRKAGRHSNDHDSTSRLIDRDDAIDELVKIVHADIEDDVSNMEAPEDLDDDQYSRWFGQQCEAAEARVREDMRYCDDGNGVTWFVVARLEPYGSGRTYELDVNTLDIIREI